MELESFQMEEIEEGLFLICIYRQGWQEVFVLSQKGARHETVIKPALQHVPDGDHDCKSFLSLVSAICLRIFTASRQMGQDTMI